MTTAHASVASNPNPPHQPQAAVSGVVAMANAGQAGADPAKGWQPLQPSERLLGLPTYIFADLNRLKQQAREQGLQLIDLGMGNPDRPTPAPIIDTIAQAVRNPVNHRYPDFEGKPVFRQAVADWMQRRYQVTVDRDANIQPLIGTKEGLAHLIQAYVGPGDVCLIPSLFYPTYLRATILCGGEPYLMPLNEANGYQPDLDAIPESVARRAKLILINYPNNPTGAVAEKAFYEKLVAFCRKYRIVLVNDMAYGELTFDGQPLDSILSVPGAADVSVEFHSFSKSFHMAGWRVGWAVGDPTIIRSLYTMKTNMDYGVCNAVQEGAAFALNHAEEFIPEVVSEYERRRDFVASAFAELGWPVTAPRGSFYFWLKVPTGWQSYEWVKHLMMTTGVVVTPGVAFGEDGDGYFRLSLVSPMEQLQEAVERLKAANIRFA